MGTFNRGDISEGILAAAIFARFLSKKETIKEKHVLEVINSFPKPKKGTGNFKYIELSLQSPNKNIRIMDTVICKIALAPLNMDALVNKKIYSDKDIKGIVQASITYANSNHIKKWADMLYENNQKNLIEVSSEGLFDQSGTKVDIRVKVDGKQCGVGVSLKYGDVKQFGQVGGADIESMNTLFSPLGIKYSKKEEDDIEEYVMDKKIDKSMKLAYSLAQKQLNNIIKNDKIKFLKNLSNFINFHATRGEKDVVLVQLKGEESHVYEFDNLDKKLKGINLNVEYTEGNTEVISGAKIPQLRIMAENKEELLKIRCKLEGNRINSKGKRLPITIRNYVEKGSLMEHLLSTTNK